MDDLRGRLTALEELGAPDLWPEIVRRAALIRAGDQVFTGEAPFEVRSDPGDGTRRTLEVAWREAGRTQRPYLYLAVDEQDWWVSEIRTYDGFDDPEWVIFD